MHPSSDQARFAALLECHGADAARWPEDERNWATAYRKAHPDNTADVHAAAALDAWLDGFHAPAPSSALRVAILAAAAAEPRTAARRSDLLEALLSLWHELGGARLAAPALAMALAAGIGLGWLFEPSLAGVTEPTDDLLALVQFDDHYMELSP